MPAICGFWLNATYAHASAIVITAAGRMKHAPATTNPIRPARRWPICSAISVEFGPGIRLQALIISRNSAGESHRRRLTTSSSIIAICAAGPPNAIVPRRAKSCANSRRSLERFGEPSERADRMLMRTALLGCERQNENLPAHRGLMAQALETDHALAMESEDL